MVVLSKTALADGDSRTGGESGWPPPPLPAVVTVTTLAADAIDGAGDGTNAGGKTGY